MHVLSALTIVIAQVASLCDGGRAPFIKNPRLRTASGSAERTSVIEKEALEFNPSRARTQRHRGLANFPDGQRLNTVAWMSSLGSRRADRISVDKRHRRKTILQEVPAVPSQPSVSRRQLMTGAVAAATVLLGTSLTPLQPAQAVDLPAQAVDFLDFKSAAYQLQGGTALSPSKALLKAALENNDYTNEEAVVKLRRNGKKQMPRYQDEGHLPPAFRPTDAGTMPEDVSAYVLEEADDAWTAEDVSYR